MENKIMLKFESELDSNSLESLFDNIATILPEDLYTEEKFLSPEGIETDYNVVYNENQGGHFYEMPVNRPLTMAEGNTLYQILDKAIDGDYMLEMSASAEELQNRHKFSSFQGSVQEGDLD
jgi:hypothetical protein